MSVCLSVWLCLFVCYFRSHTWYLVQNKNVKDNIYRFWYSQSKWTFETFWTLRPWRTFWRSNILNDNIAETVRDSAKCIERLSYILIFAIEWEHCETEPCDLDLLFEGQQFELWKYLKLWVSVKMHHANFIDDGFFCVEWRKVHYYLDLPLEVQKFETLIYRTERES